MERSFKFQVLSREKARAQDFTLYTSHSAEGRSCETNPICPAGPGGARPQGRGTRDKCAKQSQFLREQQEEQVLCGKEVMVNWSCTGLRRNKANSWRARYPPFPCSIVPAFQSCPCCAKQTQFRRDFQVSSLKAGQLPAASSRAFPHIPLFRYSIIPPFQLDADRAKRTQLSSPAVECRAPDAQPIRCRSGQALRRAGGKIDRLQFRRYNSLIG